MQKCFSSCDRSFFLVALRLRGVLCEWFDLDFQLYLDRNSVCIVFRNAGISHGISFAAHFYQVRGSGFVDARTAHGPLAVNERRSPTQIAGIVRFGIVEMTGAHEFDS